MKKKCVEHLAGKPTGLIQCCERCNMVLIDYINADVVASFADAYSRSLRFWQPGAHVYTDGTAWTVQPGQNSRVQPCLVM
jgi:hypothetical protein